MPDTVLTIGNFDGVHRGHQALLDAARQAAGDGGRVVAMTFDPLPRHVLSATSPGLLATVARRQALLASYGADEVHVASIDQEWLRQDAEAFIDHVVTQWSPTVLVEGPDFRFGRDRGGDIEVLRAAGQRHGFEVHVIDPVEAPLANQVPVPVRSSQIRWLLEHGRVHDAACLLGRPWRLEGPVVSGDQRGRVLNCPTANLDHGDLLLPADGVYAGLARCPGGVFPAAISVSDKPTFARTPRLLEAHLLGWQGPMDAYGWALEVDLMYWVRDQIRFDDVAALQAQMARDLKKVSELLSDVSASTLQRS